MNNLKNKYYLINKLKINYKNGVKAFLLFLIILLTSQSGSAIVGNLQDPLSLTAEVQKNYTTMIFYSSKTQADQALEATLTHLAQKLKIPTDWEKLLKRVVQGSKPDFKDKSERWVKAYMTFMTHINNYLMQFSEYAQETCKENEPTDQCCAWSFDHWTCRDK